MRMYILSDGKNYVIDNPIKPGEVMMSTAAPQAKQFTFKQARTLLRNTSKRLSWIRDFHMISCGDQKEIKLSEYEGNRGIYNGKNKVDFDRSIVNTILMESSNILGLAGWNQNQLETYYETLETYLSVLDSQESDIKHAFVDYMESNDGKKPAAHKVAKIGYRFIKLRIDRRDVKQCLQYIEVMQNANTYGYTIEKLKSEINKAKFKKYAARTEVYKEIIDLLTA